MEFLKQWYQTILNYTLEIGGEAKKYVEVHQIKIKTSNENYIFNWIGNAQYFIKNQNEFKEVDIRQFLVAKSEIKGKSIK